jgi:phosphatidylserine decarboxylase
VLSDYLKSLPLYPLPQHLISRIIYFLTRRRTRLKNPAIRWFINRFRIDMSEAVEQDIERYPTFNAFFTRAIRPELRPVADELEAVASPVDGIVSQLGTIDGGRIIQAKSHDYSALELLGGSAEWSRTFENGRFITLYLAPSNYHRIHMPNDGRLRHMLHVPGRLFSVAPHTVRAVPRLFARNERVVSYFDGPTGPFALVLVGALNVAAIETVWHGLVTPPQSRSIRQYDYADKKIVLAKGEEMGRFNMGSTVILLTPPQLTWESSLKPGQAIKMGQKLATFKIQQGPA